MPALKKFSMNLTDMDIKNTERVRKLFHVRTNADAISASLSIARSLGEMIRDGKELLLRNKQGEIEKILIHGLISE